MQTVPRSLDARERFQGFVKPLGAVQGDAKNSASFSVFGIHVPFFERTVNLGRPFMARFGDIARIDARGRDLRVTLKSGTEFHLNRYAADDLADGVRVWDASRGVTDIGEWRIRSIELLADASSGDVPGPLYGTVRTSQGDFTGFVQWNRKACLITDALEGHKEDGAFGVRFESIQSIAEVRVAEMLRATDLDGKPLSSTELPLRYAIENRRPVHRKFRIAGGDGVERCVEGTAFPLVCQVGDHVGTVSLFWEAPE